MIRIKYFFLAALVIGAADCSSLLTRKDYSMAVRSVKEWDVKGAIDVFPEGEDGGFITTMEKTYLNLLTGNPDIDDLADYAEDIDNQVRVRVSRELKSFFFVETPEGYYASEHEIIWMHLLLSWGYSMRGDPEKARVEAKISSDLIGRNWSEEGRFDDPMMRVILAGMWAMCGEWEEARVDFRAAQKLDPSLKWAGALAGMDTPPEDLVIILGGPGQEPEWVPQLKSNPFRGFRGIRFNPQGVKSSLVLTDSGGTSIPMALTPDSSNWYKRHFIRDNEMQDVIKDSAYAQKAAASAVKGTIVTLGGITLGVIVAAGGIALGAGIIVLGIYAESAELAAAGLISLVGGPMWGYDIAEEAYRKSVRDSKRDMDAARTYRFVRFLPEYAWVGASAEKFKEPVTIYKKGRPLLSSEVSVVKPSVNIVTVGFYPDTISVQTVEKPRLSYGRAVFLDKNDKSVATELYAAVRDNDFDKVKYLVDNRADINITNEEGESPLHAAIRKERSDIAKILIENGAEVNTADKAGISPLHTAVTFEMSDVAGLLVEKGAHVNARTNAGWTPLHEAVCGDNLELTRFLLKRGADAKARTNVKYDKYPAGATPLMMARINLNTGIEKFLIKYGAAE